MFILNIFIPPTPFPPSPILSALLLKCPTLPTYSLLGFPIAISLCATMRNGCFLLRIRVARNINIFVHWFAISIAQNVVIANMNFALFFYCDFALLYYCALYSVKYPCDEPIAPSYQIHAALSSGISSLRYSVIYIYTILCSDFIKPKLTSVNKSTMESNLDR